MLTENGYGRDNSTDEPNGAQGGLFEALMKRFGGQRKPSGSLSGGLRNDYRAEPMDPGAPMMPGFAVDVTPGGGSMKPSMMPGMAVSSGGLLTKLLKGRQKSQSYGNDYRDYALPDDAPQAPQGPVGDVPKARF